MASLNVNGAKFTAKSFFRPTTMSIAMAEAGLIPAGHLVRELASTAVVRHQHDNRNIRPSLRIAF